MVRLLKSEILLLSHVFFLFTARPSFIFVLPSVEVELLMHCTAHSYEQMVPYLVVATLQPCVWHAQWAHAVWDDHNVCLAVCVQCCAHQQQIKCVTIDEDPPPCTIKVKVVFGGRSEKQVMKEGNMGLKDGGKREG